MYASKSSVDKKPKKEATKVSELSSNTVISMNEKK
jgi:hypothetical protein